MTPTASSEAASRAYDTRLKGRLQNVQKKYDDIFSAVFKKTSSTEFITANPSFRRRPDIHYFDGDRKRSTSSSESIGTSDSGHETDSNGSQSPTFEDIEIIEINHKEEPKVENAQDIPKHKCECGSLFVKHHQLHEHIHMKHSFARLFRCTTCSITIKGIRNNYVCRICKQFVAANMDSHLRDHYQDRKGDNAFMECRCCYKSFKTVEEVRAHERRVHFAHRQILTQWSCEYCPKVFNTRHNRDAHLVGHVSNSVGGIWEKITQMQELLTDQTLVNQCPICDSVMGSRKSFRLHIIHKHLLRDTTHFISSMGLPNVSAVLQAMRDNARITDNPVKSEVKGEITSESTMDDQMEIKTEPVE